MMSSASSISAAEAGSENLNLPELDTAENPANIATAAELGLGSQDDHTRISKLAYSLWCQRGCPDGSPEVDWFRAEQEFRQP